MKHRPAAPPCPRADLHTPHPHGYVAEAVWAEEMLLTHHQERCPGCNLWAIWVPTDGAPTLPPIDYRLDHKECPACKCGGAPGCECWHHRPLPLSWWVHHLAAARKRRDERPKRSDHA